MFHFIIVFKIWNINSLNFQDQGKGIYEDMGCQENSEECYIEMVGDGDDTYYIRMADGDDTHYLKMADGDDTYYIKMADGDDTHYLKMADGDDTYYVKMEDQVDYIDKDGRRYYNIPSRDTKDSVSGYVYTRNTGYRKSLPENDAEVAGNAEQDNGAIYEEMEKQEEEQFYEAMHGNSGKASLYRNNIF